MNSEMDPDTESEQHVTFSLQESVDSIPEPLTTDPAPAVPLDSKPQKKPRKLGMAVGLGGGTVVVETLSKGD